MKAPVAKPPRRPASKLQGAPRKRGTTGGKQTSKVWTPPDFKRRLREDFGGEIKPFRYVDFLER